MARILIVEPHADVRALLELVVRRLGHDPVVDIDGAGESIDAAVIEPGEAPGMQLAHRLRERGVPLLFTSIFPADDAALALEPCAYLVKPFRVYSLEAALTLALASAGAVL